MSFFSSNIEALRRRFPELADIISASSADTRISFCPSRSGPPSANLGDLAIHSRYDPEAEARRSNASFPQEAQACVFFGFGLAYHVEAFLRERPDSLAIVVEPDVGILSALLAGRDMAKLLSDDRLSILLGARSEALSHCLEELRIDEPLFFALKAYQDSYTQAHALIDQGLRRYSAKQKINENTLKRFGKLWVRNLSRNLDGLGRYPGIAAISGAFSGIPALVIAAGPSLDLILPHLPRLSESCLIIAVDTAARAVQGAGINPDFCLVVDPQYWNTKHLEGFDPSSSILISESAVYPSVLRQPWRAIFLGSSIFPLGRFMEERMGHKGRLGAGGSVATSAWDLARLLGCRPIYMAGLDLGFPGRSTHSRDSFFERRALLSATRLKPVELDSFLAFRSADPYLAADNSGGLVYTDKRMALYAWWFESKLAGPEAPLTVNLSARGLCIPGMARQDLECLFSLAPARSLIKEKIQTLFSQNTEGGLCFEDAYKELIASLSQLASGARRALDACAAALERLAKGKPADKELDTLARLDLELMDNPAKEVVSFLFAEIASLAGGKPKDLREALENSKRIYGEALRLADFHIETLSRSGSRPSSAFPKKMA